MLHRFSGPVASTERTDRILSDVEGNFAPCMEGRPDRGSVDAIPEKAVAKAILSIDLTLESIRIIKKSFQCSYRH